MVKRSHTSDSANSSEYEHKSDISDEENEDDYEDIKSPKKKSPPQFKKAKKLKPPPKRVWTPVEDQIFLDIMNKVVKAGMWDAVKDDGRLGYRGCPGVATHVTAVMNEIKKT